MNLPQERGSVSDSAHLRSIDGMRALAIGLVVAYHAWLFSWATPTVSLGGTRYTLRPLLETGFIGVQLFFFISGFCLFLPYARAMYAGMPPPKWWNFAERRALKIVPSAYLAIVVTFAFAAPELRARGDMWRAIWTHCSFTSGWWIETYRDWNGVFWSLSIEVSFYVLFPFIAAAVRRNAIVTLVALVTIAVVERCVTADCCASDYIRTNQLPAYLDLFAFGIAAAIGYVAICVRAPELSRRSGVWTLVSLVALALFGEGIASLSTGVNAAPLPIGSVRWLQLGQLGLGLVWALFAIATPFAIRPWRAVVGNRVLVWLAGISYNLYLWHVLAIMWLIHRGFPATIERVHADPVLQGEFVAAALALGIAAATVVTYGFERPLMGLARRTRDGSGAAWVPFNGGIANGRLSSGLCRVLMLWKRGV